MRCKSEKLEKPGLASEPATVFDPQHNFILNPDNIDAASASGIEALFELRAQALNEYFFSLSPLRLALQEVVTELALFYNWDSEEEFESAVQPRHFP